MTKAIKAATRAAQDQFDSYLGHNTAAMHVPQSVIDAANIAYRAAGGKGDIVVRGHGNTTHPVCSVTVESANG